MLTKQQIAKLPKTDLHVHLDGSLRLGTLIDLAKSRQVKLPSWTEAGLKELVFKDQYANLPEYLHGFKYTCAVLRDPEALERVAYELAQDNMAEGVRYVEVRFAPQLHVSSKMDVAAVLHAVDRGLGRAQSEINQLPEIVNGKEPPFAYGIIGCAMRKFTSAFSPYYHNLCSVHQHALPQELYALASNELVRALVESRDRDGVSIVGFDLAGEEKGYPAEIHREAYQFAHAHFLQKTVHAGEAYGPSSIYQAIADCHADRIGHGTHLFREDLVELESQLERQQYVKNLAGYISEKRITIEVCLTSNMQTMPEIGSLAQHPFLQMNRYRLSTTFCTDNRLISNTTVTNEVALAVKYFGLDRERVRHLLIYGFKRSFYPGSYLEKRQYVRKVIDYYHEIADHFNEP